MTDQERERLILNSIWSKIADPSEFTTRRPLLAHYTSIATLEKIVQHKELWFSNPLFMNDMQELQYGINLGETALYQSQTLKNACGDQHRYQILIEEFQRCLNNFRFEHYFDTYALCFSEHDQARDSDGLLSMWRGYGNHGNGAAIVIDSAKINPIDGTSLLLGNVHYGTSTQREGWVRERIEIFSKCIESMRIPTEHLKTAAFAIFERIKLFAIFSKHDGFSEEREWRAVYVKEQDRSSIFSGMLSYSLGPRGIEPKLKLSLGPTPGWPGLDLSLANIVNKIVLGPSLSSPMMIKSVHRMLDSHGISELKERITASTTPYRNT